MNNHEYKNKDPGANDTNFKHKTKKQKKPPRRRKSNEEKEFTPHDLSDLRQSLDKKEQGFYRKLATKRLVKKRTHDIIVSKLVSISLVSILLIIGVLYAISYTYTIGGSGINIIAENTRGKSISLSESAQFDNLTVGLKAKGIDGLDNTTHDWLPKNPDNNLGGSNNGYDYILYTFYVVNTGMEDLDYQSSLNIIHSTKKIETAIRVKVYLNGEPTIYTHKYEEEIDAHLEHHHGYEVQTFASDSQVLQKDQQLKKGKHDKYTVVIWLEGEDPDCVDDKLDGELKLTWRFTVT